MRRIRNSELSNQIQSMTRNKQNISRSLKRKPASPALKSAAANRDSSLHIKKRRSSLLRRRRTSFSSITFLHSSNNPSLTDQRAQNPTSSSFATSLHTTDDELSCCNTIRDSFFSVIDDASNRRPSAPYADQKLEKKTKIERVSWNLGGAAEAEVSECSCVDSSSLILCEVESEPLPPSLQIRHAVFKLSAPNSVTSWENAESYKCSGLTSTFVSAGEPNSPSTIEQKSDAVKKMEASESALACTECLSDDDVSSALTFFEFRSNVFSGHVGDLDFSSEDYSPSMWMDAYSDSQFSERSSEDNPSPGYCLFKHFSEEFVRLSSHSATGKVSSNVGSMIASELTFWRFEDDVDEMSYQSLRIRERTGGVKLRDYMEEYASTTEYADMIVKQRLLMVEWILGRSNVKELHNETRFLALRLLDRFLSKGYFKSTQNLELVGIACLTLAARIEENQPYNSMLEKKFQVEQNSYSRTEVVAMEWLVQEVLKFQCFSPTTYNFLWFYLKAARADEDMEEKVRVLAELAMLDHKQAQFWPSSLAAGLVVLASLVAKRDSSCQIVMQAHLRTTIDDLPECIKWLEWLVPYVTKNVVKP